MDWHDQELLDKQLRGIIPPRHDGVIAIMVAGMFFAGLTLGAELTHKSAPSRTAANESVIAFAVPAGQSGAAVR